MVRDDFAIFILSNGRANNIKTLNTLKEANYSGKWYIIIDDEDKTKDDYFKAFGDRVIMFSKEEVNKKIDVGDNFSERRAIVYARNESFEIAKDLGLNYFLQLDDDYNSFEYRFDDGEKLAHKTVDNFNELCNAMVDFLEVSGAKTVTMAQGGDFIGGRDGGRFKQGIVRKAMNTFFCKVDRPIDFIGKLNEDVSTYTYYGSRGELFFTITSTMVSTATTQKDEGGISEVYKTLGTYVKSFYSVMYMPSAIKISVMGESNKRVHHKVKWDKCSPKILNERYKVI